mmetsp:Transcript_91658/g.262570  ORF Transcript_91658/g.262570 Transcript_91658/m.262570 type:complete len:216 (-) Transcript_91658:290-937(-)
METWWRRRHHRSFQDFARFSLTFPRTMAPRPGPRAPMRTRTPRATKSTPTMRVWVCSGMARWMRVGACWRMAGARSVLGSPCIAWVRSCCCVRHGRLGTAACCSSSAWLVARPPPLLPGRARPRWPPHTRRPPGTSTTAIRGCAGPASRSGRGCLRQDSRPPGRHSTPRSRVWRLWGPPTTTFECGEGVCSSSSSPQPRVRCSHPRTPSRCSARS